MYLKPSLIKQSISHGIFATIIIGSLGLLVPIIILWIFITFGTNWSNIVFIAAVFFLWIYLVLFVFRRLGYRIILDLQIKESSIIIKTYYKEYIFQLEQCLRVKQTLNNYIIVCKKDNKSYTYEIPKNNEKLTYFENNLTREALETVTKLQKEVDGT